MGDSQPPPYLRDLLIEWKDGIRIITRDRPEPATKTSRLCEVAAMSHGFDALAQLANRDGREVQCYVLRRSLAKELTNTGVGARALSC
jgi:hypothetical protein